jgi:hypothetical protein
MSEEQEPNSDIEKAINQIVDSFIKAYEMYIEEHDTNIPVFKQKLLSLLSPTTPVKMELISDEEIKRLPNTYESDKTLYQCMLSEYNPTAVIEILKVPARKQLSADSSDCEALLKEQKTKILETLQNDGVLCTPEEAEKNNCSYCKKTYKDLSKY